MSVFNRDSLNRIRLFLEKEIWQINLSKIKGASHFGIKMIRTLIIAWRGFRQDNCQLKASALTFYTLLSIVPVIAMLFGIAKGFGLEKKLETEIRADLSYNQEMIGYFFDLANSMLENTRGGLIAGLGVVLLFWSVMKVLGNIEKSFNDIWEIKKSRSLIRKFSDYLALMLVAPIMIIVAGSALVYINAQIESATNVFDLMGVVGPFVFILVKGVPVLVTLLLMTLVYMLLPNTKVNFGSALTGAFFASVLLLLIEWGYISFQVGVSKYNAIYGGFAALPLFLIWVQTNWLVVLLGAELSFAYQNQSKYEFELEANEISVHYEQVLAVAVMKSLVKRFVQGDRALTISEISEGLQLPSKLIRKNIYKLVKCHVISEISGDNNDEARFQPAIDVAQIDIEFVLKRFSEAGINELPIEPSKEMQLLEERIGLIRSEIKSSPNNVLLKDL